MSKTLYDVLGVARGASEDEITRAYRKLAKTCHPDLHPGDKKAEEKFKRINAAYEILGDKDKRARYDRGEIDDEGRERAFTGGFRPGGEGTGPFGGGHFEFRTQGGGFPFDDILADLFKMSGRGGRASASAGASGFATPGEDVRLSLTVELPEAARGATRRVTLPDGQTVDLNIPAGIEDGKVLRLKGKGQASLGGAGDALVEVKVAEHPVFTRKGLDIHVDQPVPLATAVLGGKVRVPTLDGEVSLTVPRHTSSGRRLRLRGKGVHDARTGRHGDQLVRVLITLPAHIDDELEAALRRWAERHGDVETAGAAL